MKRESASTTLFHGLASALVAATLAGIPARAAAGTAYQIEVSSPGSEGARESASVVATDGRGRLEWTVRASPSHRESPVETWNDHGSEHLILNPVDRTYYDQRRFKPERTLMSGANPDRQIAEQLASLHGIAMKRIVTATRTFEGSEPSTESRTFEIVSIADARVDEARLVVPNGYRYQEPVERAARRIVP